MPSIGYIVFGIIAVLCLLAIGLLSYYKPDDVVFRALSILGLIVCAVGAIIVYKNKKEQLVRWYNTKSPDEEAAIKYDIDVDDINEYELDIAEYRKKLEEENTEQTVIDSKVEAARQKARSILQAKYRAKYKNQFKLTAIGEKEEEEALRDAATKRQEFFDELRRATKSSNSTDSTRSTNSANSTDSTNSANSANSTDLSNSTTV